MAAVAHAATLDTRIPFLHFFDGFRTSHEVAKIEELGDDDLRALINETSVFAHRERGLTPDRPVIRGTAQNPDVFYQAREAANRFYDACPAVVERVMKQFAELTGRRYGLFEYVGDPAAERVANAQPIRGYRRLSFAAFDGLHHVGEIDGRFDLRRAGGQEDRQRERGGDEFDVHVELPNSSGALMPQPR